MKKLLIAVGLLAAAALPAKATVTIVQGSSFTYVIISTSLQANTTGPWGINVGSGTIQNFRVTNFISTGTWTFAATTLNGTKTDNSTTTFTAANTFNTSQTFSFADTNTRGNGTAEITVTNTSSIGTAEAVINGNTDQGGGGSRRGRITFARSGSGGNIILETRNSDGVTFSTGVFVSSSGATSITGTIVADNAPPGTVGEYISSTTSSGAMGTSAQYFDVASISLTAGDWDLTGTCFFTRNGATYSAAGAGLECGIGTATGNNATGVTLGDTDVNDDSATTLVTFNAFSLTIPTVRKSLSATTIIYLKAYAGTYTVGSPLQRGRISARRMR